MICPLALLRPEPGWSTSAAAARAQGMTPIGHPLFTAEPLRWALPEGGFDALLVGSAAVFACAGADLAALRHLPVHAVGAATAAAARAAGFRVARSGAGGLQALLDNAAGEALRYLRLGGAERVPLTPHSGQAMTEIAIYRMRPEPLAPDFAARLARGGVVAALHSAAAAAHFGRELDRLSLGRERIAIAALGPRIARAAGDGWRAIAVADRPADAELLAKAGALCKDDEVGRMAADKVADGSQNGNE